MIPRLHPRGQSFQGACSYILHDADRAKTNERVAWTMTPNLTTKDPNWAWHEMVETYWAQGALKAASGQDQRGRKNTKPVLHYTLSWAESDNPSPEEMKQAALSSLKALGLEEHEALITGHQDKKHLHAHIVVNTVHPQTGMTAPLKFSKLDLSKWAEGYERERVIHCEERVTNNAERERIAAARRRDPSDLLMGRKAEPSALLMAQSRTEGPAKAPYVPVKHQTTHRKQWFEKKELADRMKALRTTLDAEIKTARDATWARHTKERDVVDARSEAAVDQARQRVKAIYRPQWRNIYTAQRKEAKAVERISGNLLERAVYVYQNRERLGVAGKALTPKQMLPLIRSSRKLLSRVASIHERERRTLARASKSESKAMTDVIWRRHKEDMGSLRDKHSAERQAERDGQAVQRKSVSLELAKASLSADRAAAPRPFQPAPAPTPVVEAPAPAKEQTTPSVEQQFKQASDPSPAPAPPSRADEIKRDMAEWRKRNDDKDFGREL